MLILHKTLNFGRLESHEPPKNFPGCSLVDTVTDFRCVLGTQAVSSGVAGHSCQFWS